MNENETYCCSNCNCEICSDEEYFTLDDEILCSDCWDEETVECENCRTRIWLDPAVGQRDTATNRIRKMFLRTQRKVPTGAIPA